MLVNQEKNCSYVCATNFGKPCSGFSETFDFQLCALRECCLFFYCRGIAHLSVVTLLVGNVFIDI